MGQTRTIDRFAEELGDTAVEAGGFDELEVWVLALAVAGAFAAEAFVAEAIVVETIAVEATGDGLVDIE